MRWSDGITDPVDLTLSRLWEVVGDRGAWRAAVRGVAEGQTSCLDGAQTTTKEGSTGVFFCSRWVCSCLS